MHSRHKAVFLAVVPCPDLSLDPPQNGALACDTWLHGIRCQLFCNSGYDIPRTVSTSAEYVCADTEGEWRPIDFVPDCSGNMDYFPNMHE